MANQVLLLLLLAAFGVLAGWALRGILTRRAADSSTLGESPEVGSLKQRYFQLEGQHAELTQLIAQIQPLSAELESRRAAIEQLTQTSANRAAEIELLRQRLAEVHQQLQERESRLAQIVGAAPDDLKQIRGIGPKLEQLLHHLEVRSFQQIALWSDADIVAFDDRLAEFRGRIRRDRWVESARELYRRKYGRDP